MLGKGGGVVLGLGPEIGGKVLVGVTEGHVDGLDEVLGGSGVTGGGGVAIIDTSELQEFLGDGSTDNTGTTGSGHELGSDGTGLSSDLHGNGMDVTDLVSPVTSTDGDEAELGGNKGTLDSNLDFLGDLDAETNMTVLVTDGNNSLKAGSLSSLGLLLDGDDLHDLIGEFLVSVLEELVNNRGFLDGDGVSVDLFEGVDHVVLHESSELGSGGPLILGGTTHSATATAASVATTASSAETATAFTVSTAFATSFTTAFATAFATSCRCCRCCFRHCV